MALDYTGSNNGLFRHIGKLIKHSDLIKSDVNNASTGLDADRNEILNAFQLGDTGNPDLVVDGLAAAVERWKLEYVGRRQALAGFVLGRLRDRITVLDEIGAASSDRTEIVRKLFERMVTDSQTINASTVTLGTVTAASGNSGNGIAVATDTLDGSSSPGSAYGQQFPSNVKYKGLKSELCVPSETMTLQVVDDQFQQGDAAVFAWAGRTTDSMGQYGLGAEGSGVIGTVSEVHASTEIYLSNADFETFTVANLPDDWTADSGTVGTHIKSTTATIAHGSKGLQLVGDGAQATIQLSQAVSGDILDPNRAYIVSAQVKADASIGAGTLTIQFEGTGYTAAASEKISIAPGSLPTSFTVKYFIINLPATIPADFKLIVKWSGTPTNAKNLYIDDVGMAPVSFGGGVGVAAVRGTTEFGHGDKFTFTVANTEGVFQRAFRQMFGAQLPSAGSPTIADSLAT